MNIIKTAVDGVLIIASRIFEDHGGTCIKIIVITGGAGFIGSHVVRLFVNKYLD